MALACQPKVCNKWRLTYRNLKNNTFALSSNTEVFYFVNTGKEGLAIHIKGIMNEWNSVSCFAFQSKI